MEQLQSVEQRLREEINQLREFNVQLESEKVVLMKKLSVHLEDHDSHVRHMESQLNTMKVRVWIRVPRTC